MNQSTVITVKQFLFAGVPGLFFAMFLSSAYLGLGWEYTDNLLSMAEYEDGLKGNALAFFTSFLSGDWFLISSLLLISTFCWYMLAARLNHALSRLPIPHNKQAIWPLVAWVCGLLLFNAGIWYLPNILYIFYWYNWTVPE